MDSLPPPDKKKRTEINERANARRDPAERSPHFSLTIEVKKDQRSRLPSKSHQKTIKQRINNAKSALGIDRSTSSTQNAEVPLGVRYKYLIFIESKESKDTTIHLQPTFLEFKSPAILNLTRAR